jgi:hypothetical protein
MWKPRHPKILWASTDCYMDILIYNIIIIIIIIIITITIINFVIGLCAVQFARK